MDNDNEMMLGWLVLGAVHEYFDMWKHGYPSDAVRDASINLEKQLTGWGTPNYTGRRITSRGNVSIHEVHP